jgi:hypothetical protein
VQNLGGGLAALAFWGFIASTVIGGIWYAIREKQAQHATLQRMIESGQKIDTEIIDKIMSDGGKSDRDLRIGAYITMSVAPGLVLLGFVLSRVNDDIFAIMSGVAGLVLFVGLGLLAASKIAERSEDRNDRPPM